jgi:hypothetical protein
MCESALRIARSEVLAVMVLRVRVSRDDTVSTGRWLGNTACIGPQKRFYTEVEGMKFGKIIYISKKN